MSARPHDPGPGPLAGLAGQLRRTLDALDELDGVKGELRASHVLEDRRRSLEMLVGQERPRTPAEALLQLAVASGWIDNIMGTMTTAEQDRLARQKALVDGCLYGIRGLLEELAGAPLDERFSDFWMTKAQDPHPVLDRLAGG